MDWYALQGDGRTLWGRPFFGDARLNAELAALSGALWRVEDGRRYLALPWDGGEFPLTELFCFARIRPIRGREYVVYCVDSENYPVM